MHKNKNGFTLIELLAVIVILGVIMVIAVPAVTKYINNSRKDSFVITAKNFIDSIKIDTQDGRYKLPASENEVTLISYNLFDLSKGGKTSPYSSKWVNSRTYIIILYNNTNNSNEYYFAGQDEKGNAIPLTMESKLDRSKIVEGHNTMPVTIQELTGTTIGDTKDIANIEGLDASLRGTFTTWKLTAYTKE